MDPKYWEPVLTITRNQLLTPVGLRTLTARHRDYKATYDGDLRARDAAYHQGTVWPWLLGPFVDAWLKVYPNDFSNPRLFLDGAMHHLKSVCLGTISEIFDATEPYLGRGCFAQAWSVAEVLRILYKLNPMEENKFNDCNLTAEKLKT